MEILERMAGRPWSSRRRKSETNLQAYRLRGPSQVRRTTHCGTLAITGVGGSSRHPEPGPA
ncbi:hypothetical protein ASE90_06625 [Sphingomonas sp. Leaf67]|nr:hypothetical protein ASE91_09965 [Sphingomonas sp. Leaf62]KQN86949.1 hypothetical protein ASE90_06625 [Sphingomonas sp. Leaf67]